MIREMRASDWEFVRKIYLQGINKGNCTFNTECPTYEEWDASHIKECRFVFEDRGRVLGWIALSPTSSRNCYRGVAEVSVYVDDHNQDKGIGTKLLKHVCEESEKAGFWTLYVAILAPNVASMALHKKCGFREIGYRERIAKDRFGNWLNTTIMERRNSIE